MLFYDEPDDFEMKDGELPRSSREPGGDVSLLPTWSEAHASISEDLSQLIGASLNATDAANALDGATVIASLPLTEANCLVYVGLGIDQATGKRLSGLLLGDGASEAAIQDMVRELANVAAGAVKRRLAADGHVFTTGLPIDTELDEFRAPVEPTAQKTSCRSWVMSLPDDASVKVCCEIELRLVRTPA